MGKPAFKALSNDTAANLHTLDLEFIEKVDICIKRSGGEKLQVAPLFLFLAQCFTQTHTSRTITCTRGLGYSKGRTLIRNIKARDWHVRTFGNHKTKIRSIRCLITLDMQMRLSWSQSWVLEAPQRKTEGLILMETPLSYS